MTKRLRFPPPSVRTSTQLPPLDRMRPVAPPNSTYTEIPNPIQMHASARNAFHSTAWICSRSAMSCHECAMANVLFEWLCRLTNCGRDSSAPQLDASVLIATDLRAARYTSPHLTSPHLTSPHLTSPHLATPRHASPCLATPHHASESLATPHHAPPRLSTPHRASIWHIFTRTCMCRTLSHRIASHPRTLSPPAPAPPRSPPAGRRR